MNRKLICLALAMVLLCAVPMAYAAPSKTTGDMTHTTGYGTLATDLTIEILPMTAEANAVLEAISAASSLSEYFGEDVWSRATALAGSDSLDLVELAPISVAGYDATLGDVAQVFSFPTVLSGSIVGMVCIGSEWTPVRAEVVNGSAKVYFPQQLLAAMNGRGVLLAILTAK